MKLTKFQPPYRPNGRTTLRHISGRSGVYIIKKNDRILYVGFSATDIYKTLYRHFQSWKDWRQVRVSYHGQDLTAFRVRVIICKPEKAAALERALIIKYQPKDNPDKLQMYLPSKQEEKAFEEYSFTPVSSNEEIEAAPF